jgi:Uma2 family endonuclease
MSDMASVYERHRITLDEYHRMVVAGVFEPDARIELIDGELIEMPPIDPPHASTVDRIMHQLVIRLGGRAWVRCQNPVTLRPASEPQPDLVLARYEIQRYFDRHPEPADTLLAIEVSESSLGFDRKIKVPLYARSGIPELWLVNLVDDEIIVHRDPTEAWYASVQAYRRGETISPIAFPDVGFAVSDLLPMLPPSGWLTSAPPLPP